MPFSRSILPVLLALLTMTGTLRAQAFEGIIRQRSLTVSDDALYEMLWAEEDDETEYETEEAYNQAMAYRLFDLSDQDLESLSAAGTADLGEFAVRIRGNRIRVEGDPGGAFSIIDLDSGTMWMVNPGERSYVEYSKADAEEAEKKAEEMMARFGLDPETMEEAEQVEGGHGKVSVTDLDLTRTINGFEAQGFRASSGEEYGEAWCSSDGSGLVDTLGKLAERTKEMNEEGQGAALEDEMCREGLPVLSKTFHPYAVLFEVSEVLAVEPGPQPAELFEVPEGYRRIDMSEYWK
jgi:hypothetical protein